MPSVATHHFTMKVLVNIKKVCCKQVNKFHIILVTGTADAFSGNSSFYNYGVGKTYTMCCKQVYKLHIILVTGTANAFSVN